MSTTDNSTPVLTTHAGDVWRIAVTPGNVELIAPASYKGTITVFGVPIGSADELAALVRDAKRYRKLKQGAMLTYMAAWKCTSAEITTAEGYHSELDSFADALPEVEP